MLKLQDPIDSCTLTSCYSKVEGRLLQLSSVLPIHPLTLVHNWVLCKDHTDIVILVELSLKARVNWNLRHPSKINPPLISSALGHALSLIICDVNISR